MKVTPMNAIDMAKPGSKVVSLTSTRLLKKCFFRLDKVGEGVGDRRSFARNLPGIHSELSLQTTNDRRCHYGEPS
jgi:hypothetical protein